MFVGTSALYIPFALSYFKLDLIAPVSCVFYNNNRLWDNVCIENLFCTFGEVKKYIFQIPRLMVFVDRTAHVDILEGRNNCLHILTEWHLSDFRSHLGG